VSGTQKLVKPGGGVHSVGGLRGITIVGFAIALMALLGACGSKTTSSQAQLSVVRAISPAPTDSSNAALYVSIENTGDAPARLIDVTTTSGTGMLHRTEISKSGQAMMTMVSGFTIESGSTLSMAAGGDHIMLPVPVGLVAGDTYAVTLSFTGAPPINTSAQVVSADQVLE
jgi:copper(I)-binding protein